MRTRYDFGRLKRHVLIFLIILILGLLNLKAASNSTETRWIGAVDSNWSIAGNWLGGRVPVSENDVVISSGFPYQPVIMSNASCKKLQVNKGAVLKLNSGTLEIFGDFINLGSFDCGSGTVVFTGNVLQTSSSNYPLFFYNLSIDNQSSEGVSFENKISIVNQLSFAQGFLRTGDTVVVLNQDADAITGYSENGYVSGNLRRSIKPASDEKYFFPVGYGGKEKYFPASIDVHSLEGTQFITVTFTALERYNPAQLDARDNEINYEFVADEGMWLITPDVEPMGGWFDLRLWISNMSGLLDNMFAILKRPAGADASLWTANFGENSAFGGEGRKLSDGYALKRYCSSFSEYGIGGTGLGIPIELIHFDAKLENGAVNLAWTTATETNNSFFIVEKSNGTDFRQVAKIEASGNSAVQRNYTAVDDNPFTGVSYYRLKQIDFDGKSKYSEVVSVKDEPHQNSMVIFPNPSEGIVKLQFLTSVPKVEVVIFNQHGTISFSKTFNNSSAVAMSLKNELLPGIYYMQISTGSGDLNIQKIVIE